MRDIIQVRVDEETKKQANDVFNKIGVDMSTAIRMFLKKCINVKGIPFFPDVTNETEQNITTRQRIYGDTEFRGFDDINLDDINEAIKKVRKEKKK